jgi:HYR domain
MKSSLSLTQRILDATGLAALVLFTALVSTLTASATSPDYIVTQSSGATIVPGTDDTGNHCDDCSTGITLPFDVMFYDQTFTAGSTIFVNSNGFLSLSTNPGNGCCGYCIPLGFTSNVISPGSSDLFTADSASGQGIFTSVSGVAPNRIFNIEWRARYCCNSGAPDFDFEVRIYEGRERIDFIYGAVAGGVDGIGIQRDTGSQSTAVSCGSAPAPGTQYTFEIPCAIATYSDSFTQGVNASSTAEQDWVNFRSSLTPKVYDTVTISGTSDPIGRTLRDATIVPQIAAALKNGTGGSWTAGGFTWNVGTCGGSLLESPATEINANDAGDLSVCSCPDPGYIVRPNIGEENGNWGGANTATCGGPSQTLTVTFSGICEQMYAATGSNAVAGNLYKIDPMTAAATLVAPITNASGGGAIGLTGLDFDPISGTLYGITANGIFGGNTVSSNLVTIDPITGVATVIGSLGRANSDISFQSNGTLFGFQAGGGSGSNPAMTTISLSTGAATPVGDSGVSSTQGGGLAFGPGGTLYVSPIDNALDTLDPATGALTTGPTLTGAPHGRLNAMAFDSHSILFASDTDHGGTALVDLVTVDTSTGAVTTIGALPDNTDAIAFVPISVPSASPRPTPTISNVPADITAEATGPSGAAVTFSSPTAVDADGNPVIVNCDHTSGSTFPLGTTTVTCTATDGQGSTATATFHVTVQDTTPPVITVPHDDIRVRPGQKRNHPRGRTVFFTVSATDLVDGSVPANASPPSGSFFPVGTTTVTVTATDNHGNQASQTFTVKVTKR